MTGSDEIRIEGLTLAGAPAEGLAVFMADSGMDANQALEYLLHLGLTVDTAYHSGTRVLFGDRRWWRPARTVRISRRSSQISVG